jgi:hypothetical protein
MFTYAFVAVCTCYCHNFVVDTADCSSSLQLEKKFTNIKIYLVCVFFFKKKYAGMFWSLLRLLEVKMGKQSNIYRKLRSPRFFLSLFFLNFIKLLQIWFL